MEGFAELLGNFIGYAVVVVLVYWILHATEVLSFLAGVFGGLFEQITKKKGYF
ncbi:MAG: hypothetical protein Q8P01_02495 [bacterium]|nr:hypothetical protein [bacterium]